MFVLARVAPLVSWRTDPLITVAPVYEFAADRMTVPPPLWVREPLPASEIPIVPLVTEKLPAELSVPLPVMEPLPRTRPAMVLVTGPLLRTLALKRLSVPPPRVLFAVRARVPPFTTVPPL